MANYFYTDASGQRQGPINDHTLRVLAAQGKIQPTTPMETEGGHKGLAEQIPGLFSVAPPPSPPPTHPHPPAQSYCTNCGGPTSAQSFGCMSCGLTSTGHKKFCQRCGGAVVNPKQVICVQCGAPLRRGAVSESKNKIIAGLLAVLLGAFGAHKFYMGSWGWGLVYLLGDIFVLLPIAAVFAFVSFGILFFLPIMAMMIVPVTSIVEGIMYFVMTDDAFAEKYPPETQSAFRW